LSAENGYYKIGRTINIQSRLRSLQREFPLEIKLVHYFECDDYIATESSLHKIYGAYRKGNTEWFALPVGAVDKICEM